MISNKCKQLAAIAALATSLVMTGGTAFAASTSVAGGADHTTGLVPGPIGDASEYVRSTVADVRNQIHRHQW
jgi:hypothetical protein